MKIKRREEKSWRVRAIHLWAKPKAIAWLSMWDQGSSSSFWHLWFLLLLLQEFKFKMNKKSRVASLNENTNFILKSVPSSKSQTQRRKEKKLKKMKITKKFDFQQKTILKMFCCSDWFWIVAIGNDDDDKERKKERIKD